MKYIILKFKSKTIRKEFDKEFMDRQGVKLDGNIFEGDMAETAADIANRLLGISIVEEGKY